MSMTIPTPRPNGDFVSYIALCVNEFCRVHPRTSINCCVDGLLENIQNLHSQKIKWAQNSPPWKETELHDPELDTMMVDVLGASKPKPESKPESKPEIKSEPKQYKIRPVTWNDKGPIVDSRILIDLIKALFERGGMTEWEEKFLGDEDGKLKFAMAYPQTFFTFHSGGIFERLCYRAGLQCPFHIDPGQTAPPDGWDA
jgi:hypothetical protein